MSDGMDRRKFLGLTPAFPAAAVTGALTLKGSDGVEHALDVSVLRLQPGDVLVFRAPGYLSMDERERIRDYADHGLQLQAKGVKVMVLEEGLTVEGVLRT